MKPKLYRSLGLMSGTSIDGIDAALIETDGQNHIRPMGFLGMPYPREFRDKLRRHLGNERGVADPEIALFEQELTKLHADIALRLLSDTGEIADLIGFHGQTLFHRPEKKKTIQIGDGALLAKLTGINVVNDFRSNDVHAGGNGAPLVPLYHRALVANLAKPVLILNIGGVSNLTWIGDSEPFHPKEQTTYAPGVIPASTSVIPAKAGIHLEKPPRPPPDILACDVGPGNALIDDWVLRHTGQPFDTNGLLAAAGKVDTTAVDKALAIDFFQKKPPKSLDRDAFKKYVPEHLNAADGAATLTMITARAVAAALPFLPKKPAAIYVAGGGRHNITLMRWIGDVTGMEIRCVDELGWSGDGLEAEAFAWLAVRSVLGLPLSLPTTTGVPKPMTGGTLHKTGN